MIWKFKAAWRLKTVYNFDWKSARELADVLYHENENDLYAADMVDEEMSYWGG